MKSSLVVTFAVMLCFCLVSVAEPDKQKSLPPGLEKNLERGKPLPPGWEKKLSVGEKLEYDIYRRGRLVERGAGYEIIRVENKLIRLIENSHEIVEILNSL